MVSVAASQDPSAVAGRPSSAAHSVVPVYSVQGLATPHTVPQMCQDKSPASPAPPSHGGVGRRGVAQGPAGCVDAQLTLLQRPLRRIRMDLAPLLNPISFTIFVSFPSSGRGKERGAEGPS